jgi:tetratricopeptide (TPR) repeat protein
MVLALYLGVVALAPAAAADAGLEQSRADPMRGDAAARLVAVERLAQGGTMDDAPRLVARLRDDDPQVREAATAALWQIWSRSGDAQIDALLAQGSAQMQSWQFEDALTTFDEVVRRRPDFAEGWNKRATVLFLMGRHEASLKDCDEVLMRNPLHFGALSGAGQNHVQLGQVEKAIDAFQRALDINPNLQGPAASIRMLEQHLRSRERGRV